MGQPFKVSMCKQAPEGRFHMAPRPHSSAILDVNENRKMAVIDHATTSCLWEVTSSMKITPPVLSPLEFNLWGHLKAMVYQGKIQVIHLKAHKGRNSVLWESALDLTWIFHLSACDRTPQLTIGR
uniref:uncharacterized protein C15orf61 homolog isoform X4 n=1 Tax=Doryrhamphus excisus TaxID=161450 RepID=UPI0025AE6DA8|nr:uncharacterized protein C15orf61 homolog isoform X4 [Doryrhamphus excisus]